MGFQMKISLWAKNGREPAMHGAVTAVYTVHFTPGAEAHLGRSDIFTFFPKCLFSSILGVFSLTKGSKACSIRYC
ncbi:hypothetical protein XELAEV_18013874mg [Xenopus laevis]|uniref:Uncharacterized protein n=1 Tax=Xenopus laevis TaxID=8355 RepID=A0A974HZK4_XENLA|nr:hypothetical protein XELAEV_18013874mg [Xenopus laevis]